MPPARYVLAGLAAFAAGYAAQRALIRLAQARPCAGCEGKPCQG